VCTPHQPVCSTRRCTETPLEVCCAFQSRHIALHYPKLTSAFFDYHPALQSAVSWLSASSQFGLFG